MLDQDSPRSDLWARFVTVMFDELAGRAGLSDSELGRRLGEELGRPAFNRQTIGAWRRGRQQPPATTLWILGTWTSTTLSEAMVFAMMRHPELRGLLPKLSVEDTDRYDAAVAMLKAIAGT